MLYNVRQEKEGAHRLPLFSHLDNCIGSRSAPAAQPTGCKLQAATADLNGLHVAGLLSPNTNEPTSDGSLICLALLVWIIYPFNQLKP